MALPTFYDTGAASVAAGSKIVSGEATFWQSVLEPGDLFTDGASGLMIRIASVDSETQLTLAHAWPGSDIVDGAYEVQLMPRSVGVQERTRQLLAKVSNGTEFKYDEAGPLADRSYYDLRRKNFGFLDTGKNPPELYVKASDAAGDWAGPFLYGTGPAPTLEFAPVATGSSGSQASLAVSGENPYNLAFTIPRGDKGERGFHGWSIEPELVVDGSRRVLRVAGFIGGEGVEPSGVGLYIGVGGLVEDISDAIDIRGTIGPQGVRGLTWSGLWNAGRAYVIDDLVADDTSDAQPATWIALAASVNSRPRDNPAAWELFPASAASTATLGYLAETKTDDYTVTIVDNGKCLIANKATAIAFTLGAAADLGNQFACIVKNVGAAELTVIVSGTDSVDGDSSITIPSTTSAIIKCDGVTFRTLLNTGKIPSKLDSSAVSAFAATLLDDADAATMRSTLGLPWEPIGEEVNAAGLSVVAFPLPAGYSAFHFEFNDVNLNSEQALTVRTSTDDGASYNFGASDYRYMASGAINTGPSFGYSMGMTHMFLSTTLQANNGRALGTFMIDPGSSTTLPTFIGTSSGVGVDGLDRLFEFVTRRNAVARINRFAVFCMSGTFITGKFRLFGRR